MMRIEESINEYYSKLSEAANTEPKKQSSKRRRLPDEIVQEVLNSLAANIKNVRINKLLKEASMDDEDMRITLQFFELNNSGKNPSLSDFGNKTLEDGLLKITQWLSNHEYIKDNSYRVKLHSSFNVEDALSKIYRTKGIEYVVDYINNFSIGEPKHSKNSPESARFKKPIKRWTYSDEGSKEISDYKLKDIQAAYDEYNDEFGIGDY